MFEIGQHLKEAHQKLVYYLGNKKVIEKIVLYQGYISVPPPLIQIINWRGDRDKRKCVYFSTFRKFN